MPPAARPPAARPAAARLHAFQPKDPASVRERIAVMLAAHSGRCLADARNVADLLEIGQSAAGARACLLDMRA